MIKVDQNGIKHYYYYKKKNGRHKKPGPKPLYSIVKKDKDFYMKRSLTFYRECCKKYKRRNEFMENEPLAYECCVELGFIKTIYPYSCSYKKCECEKMCRVYKTSDELLESDETLYEYLLERGWLSDIFPYYRDRYSKSSCHKIASQYKTFKEFRDGSPCIYEHCLHKGWLKEYDWLIDDRIHIYTDKVDLVYMYLFETERSVYIGRTLARRVKDRDREHVYSYDDSIHRFSKEHNIPVPEIKILESGLTLSEGLEKEDYYIEYYRKLGYTVLNKAKTGLGHGSIGSLGYGKWSKDKCYQKALECNTITEFDQKYGGACRVAKRNGWVKDYTWFKEKPRHNYWTLELCKEIANDCDTRMEFYKKDVKAYAAAHRNGWLEIIFNNKGRTYMKAKKIYKIDPTTMKVVGEYSKIGDITSDKYIYSVISGERRFFKDGYLYRRDNDVTINTESGIVTDLLCSESKAEKKYKKYSYTIDLLKNSQLSISEICALSRRQGIKICEATCRKLQKEFGLKELE